MKPQYHVASSVLVASILYLLFKSWSMALTCLISGIFIDIDHVYDYVREFGFPFKIKDFFNATYNKEVSRWTLVLHSWELLFLIGIVAWLTNWNPWITGVLIGFTPHLLLDTMHHSKIFWTYSFIWRWKHNFKCEAFYCNVAENNND